jgi:hypothetical protein
MLPAATTNLKRGEGEEERMRREEEDCMRCCAVLVLKPGTTHTIKYSIQCFHFHLAVNAPFLLHQNGNVTPF